MDRIFYCPFVQFAFLKKSAKIVTLTMYKSSAICAGRNKP